MNNKNTISDVLKKQDVYAEYKDSGFYIKDKNLYITEKDFYPPYDNRFLKSYVSDIYGGDNFAEYSKYIFDLYEDEGWYD